MKIIRITIDASKAFYEEMLFFFAWGLIALLAALVVIPLPFALAGVWMIAHRSVRGLGVKWKRCWEAVKTYGPRGLLLALIILLVYGVLAVNLWFYNTPEVSPFPPKVGLWTTPLWIVLMVVWTGTAFYAEALLLELKEPKLFFILRNALSLTIMAPLTTLLLLVLCGLLIVLCLYVPPLFVALPGFIATLSITAVRTLTPAILERYGELDEEEEGETEGETASAGATEDDAPLQDVA